MSNSVFYDSLEVEYVTNIELLKGINSTKDITISQLQHKINNLNLIADNNTQSIDSLKGLVEIKDKKLRRSGTYKKLLTLGLIIAGVIVIIK